MPRFFVSLMVLFLVLELGPAQESKVDLGITLADGRLRSFYLAVGDYYRVPERQVVATKERYRLHEEELPVVYFLAARARVEPSVIIERHIGGMSWLDITFYFGLDPEIYYIPVKIGQVGPPYGNAYGYYKKYRPGKEWKKIFLTDHEVVDLVNLRFISEHYRLTPEVVMEMRSQGKNFININEEAGKAKAKQKGEQGKDKKDQAGKGKTKHR